MHPSCLHKITFRVNFFRNTHFATELQRFFVVLMICLCLHLSQKQMYMKAPKLISLTVLLLFQAAVTTVFAQDKPKAGSVISGIVSDSTGPMMMVNVVERDSNDRIVAHSITDIEGVFSFRLVDPDHKIQVSYPGYKTDTIPIDI